MIEKRIKYYEYGEFNEIEKISNGSVGKVYKASRRHDKYVALRSFSLDIATVKEVVYEVTNQLLLHHVSSRAIAGYISTKKNYNVFID